MFLRRPTDGSRRRAPAIGERRISNDDLTVSGYTALTKDNRMPPPGVTFLEKPFRLARLDEAIRKTFGT